MFSKKEFEEYLNKFLGFTKSSSFSLSSFVGGLGFGTGLSLVFTKTVKTVFVLSSSGLLLVMVLNRHGYLNVNVNKLLELFCLKLNELVESLFKLVNLEAGNKLNFLKNLCNSFSEAELSSATFGLLTGFTFGLLLL